MNLAFKTLDAYGLVPPSGANCWWEHADKRRQTHWRCKADGHRYLVHISPRGNPVNHVTDGWKRDLTVHDSPYSVADDETLASVDHEHGRGSMKLAFETFVAYGLDPTGDATCWFDYADERPQSHWRCRVRGSRYTVHVTPRGNPVNYVTDGWDFNANVSDSPYLIGGGVGEEDPVSGGEGAGCDPSYPDFCIPAPPPDLDCRDVGGPFTVVGYDPHGFDADGDGVGCEWG